MFPLAVGAIQAAESSQRKSNGRKEMRTMKYVAPGYVLAEPVMGVDSLVTPPVWAAVAIIVIVTLAISRSCNPPQ